MQTTARLAKNKLYPVFLKLDQLNILLVGAGSTALIKLRSLLSNAPAANITIVAPLIKQELRDLLNHFPGCTIKQRAYTPADLENKQLVILASNNHKLHETIAGQAKQKGIFVNVDDAPALCNVYLHSTGEVESLGDVVEIEAEEEENGKSEKRWKQITGYSLLAFALMLIGHFIFSYVPVRAISNDVADWARTLDEKFPLMILAGFLAQMVDGATSMGYGVTSAIVLMSANISPAAISGSIHTAEMFASGASGYSHYKFGNVNKKLFKALLIPGVLGAILGAVLLVKFGDTHINWIRPIMAVYTFILGVKIFITAFRKITVKRKFKRYGLLAGTGGFLDSFGGGGWGPIVTATLITKGRTPRFVVGSVSLTEFFVTLASAFTFFTLIGVQHWQVILGLIVGGLLAAPIAARLTGKLPRKASFICLGIVIIAWSLRIFFNAL